MREVPDLMDSIWGSGNYVGVARPMVRATIEHVDMRLFDIGYNVYASLIFGEQKAAPKELPNVKSLRWSRGIDTDVASGSMALYNTAPQPVGTTFQPEYGIDQPGYYTFTRGATSFASRWGQTTNEWTGLVVPDNIIRTYEGYGFDASVCPEDDAFLVQTGVWIIKDVEYTAQGLITLALEDLASILKDQVAFHPVIPKNFYPLSFTSKPKESGVRDGYTVTKTVDSGGNYDPAHPPPDNWTGPNAVVPGVVVSGGLNRIFFDWDAVPAPPTGYTVVGYNLVIDGVRIGGIVQPPSGLPLIYEIGIVSGNVYTAQVAVVYKQTSTGYEHVGPYGSVRYAYPKELGGQSKITNVFPDTGPPPTDPSQATMPKPGTVAFDYTGSAEQVLIFVFKGDSRTQFSMVPSGAGTRQYFDTGLGTLVQKGILVYGKTGGQAGEGQVYQGGGEFFAPPTNGAPPHSPNPPAPVPVVTTKAGTATVLNPIEYDPKFSATSNAYYVGNDDGKEVYGHAPEDALDSSQVSYWLSIGNDTPGAGFAYEWFQVSLGNVEVSKVVFKTAKANYGVYLSVYAKGVWVHHDADDIIPYNPKLPESHNGGNIPYCESATPGGSEGPHTITLRKPIPGVTKIRITFHNLQNFGVGTFKYRAGLRDIRVFGTQSKTVATSTSTTTVPPPIAGPPQDDNSPTVVQTYTSYIPPEVKPGAGELPGQYEDYTDIIKLCCAWGGFYWPDAATYTTSCGTTRTYDWGPGLYGFKNVDPVLGDQNGGRVWGDFQDTGTAGVSDLPIGQFDKKPLLDIISGIREIIGYLFFIDETGGPVWRLSNIFSIGNYLGALATGPARTGQVVTIDEKQTLIDLRAKLSSRNVRERYFIAGTDGKTGALAKGFNPNPIGLRRVAGWTDQHFGSDSEAQLMADMIAIRALMAYRVDTIQIPGYPRIQVDDQVRIFERITNEGYLHYVRGISSNNDLESGVWTYDLDTNWLGEKPFETWLFNPADLSDELQQYIDAVTVVGGGGEALPPPLPNDPMPPVQAPGPTSNPGTTGGTTSEDVRKVAKFVQVTGNPAVYITDGIYRRHVRDGADKNFLVSLGVVPNATITPVTATELHYLQLVGPDAAGAP